MQDIELSNVSLNYGFSKSVLDGATMTVNSGEKVALVGDNGTGKTSILRLIAGEETPSLGSESTNSIFVFLTLSNGLKVSKCCGPIAVRIPMFGFTISQISLISPTYFAPISQMKSWCVEFNFSFIVRTTPIVVL